MNFSSFGMNLNHNDKENERENPAVQKTTKPKMRGFKVQNHNVTKAQEYQKILQELARKRKLARQKRLKHQRDEYKQRKHRRAEKIKRKTLNRLRDIVKNNQITNHLAEMLKLQTLNKLQEIVKSNHIADHVELEKTLELLTLQTYINYVYGCKISSKKWIMCKICRKNRLKDFIKKLNTNQTAVENSEELQKERRELEAQLKPQEKKIDYFERAKRLEEIPLLQVSMKERQLQDQAFWKQQEKERIASAIEERKLAVATRDRLARMKPDRDSFLQNFKQEWNAAYEDKLKIFEKHLNEERQKRLHERKLQRKEERRANYIKEKKERKLAEQKRKEEEEKARLKELAKKKRKEKKKAKREERKKKAKEQQEILKQVAAKQKQQFEEIQERLAEEKKMTGYKAIGVDPSSWHITGQGKKEREKEKLLPKERAGIPLGGGPNFSQNRRKPTFGDLKCAPLKKNEDMGSWTIGSWRSRKADDDKPRRSQPPRGGGGSREGREEQSDWKSFTRRNDLPKKGAEKRRVPLPPKEKPREQTETEEAEGWVKLLKT